MLLYPEGTNIAASKEVLPFNVDELAESAQQCVKGIAEAIQTDQIQTEKDEVESFFKQFELQYNRLNIEAHKSAFYFGQISAIMLLTRQLQNSDDEVVLFRSVVHNNPKLSECVIAIGECDTLSSSELRKKLNMRHRSNLSNLIKRQMQYSFIVSYRFGNENMYKLSKRGREFYFFIVHEDKRRSDKRQMEATIYALLTTITHCIKSNKLDGVSIARAFPTNKEIDGELFNSTIFQRQLNDLSDAFAASQRFALQIGLKNFVSRRKIKGRDSVSGMYSLSGFQFELGDEFSDT